MRSACDMMKPTTVIHGQQGPFSHPAGRRHRSTFAQITGHVRGLVKWWSGAGSNRRPSAFQAGHIPSWRRSCERYALSPVAADSGWPLLLLSPLLSAATRPRLATFPGQAAVLVCRCCSRTGCKFQCLRSYPAARCALQRDTKSWARPRGRRFVLLPYSQAYGGRTTQRFDAAGRTGWRHSRPGTVTRRHHRAAPPETAAG